MALVNHAKGEINAKIVYYGPVSSGKGTNLNYIYRKLKPEHRGQIKIMNVEKNRMLFFDFAPAGQGKVGDYNVRFHVYSIVGEVSGDTAWKMLLKGADGIVFVADSSPEKMDANIERLDELRRIMRGYGMSIKDLPGVLQCNKRDAGSLKTMAEMENDLNYGGFTVIPSVASKGEGVLESLFSLMKGVMKNLRESGVAPGAEAEPLVAPEAPEPVVREQAPIEPPPVSFEEEPQTREPEPSAPSSPDVEESAEAVQPVMEPVVETGESGPVEPVIELAGQAEPLADGRLRLPLKVRCGNSERKFELKLAVSVALD